MLTEKRGNRMTAEDISDILVLKRILSNYIKEFIENEYNK